MKPTFFKRLNSLMFIVIGLLSSYSHAQNPTVINDSLVVNNRVYAKEKLIVDKEAKFKEDIKVLGTARLLGELIVEGTAKFNGNVKMENLGTLASIDSTAKMVVILPNGQLKTINIPGLIQGIYAKEEACKEITPSHPFPVWAHGNNKIYAYYCDPISVGIGTPTPLHTLDVRGTSYAQKFLAGNSTATNDALINAYGTTSDLMHVGVKIGASPEEVRFVVTANGAIKAINVGSNPTLTINNGTGHAIIAYSNAGDKILQLENDGLLRTRVVRVDAFTWADFVFDKNYELPKLKDVAKYIETNKHLPGIPSAQEIQENGLNVGEMQTLQMQKIEELTLYMIQMDQKIEAMNNEINALKKENQELKKSQPK